MKHQSDENQDMQLALGRLVTGFAHEIRNPLNAITALLEAMFLDIENKEAVEPYKKYIDAQVDRLNRLMKDLLELGKPDYKSDYIEIDLIQLCSSTAEFWNQAPTTDTSNVRFTNNTQRGAIIIKGDYTRFQQVLINLFENASIHTSTKEDIDLTIAIEEDTIYLNVIDKGSGISKDIEQNIFEPFFTTRKSGTGLGLGIARHIVEAHNGTLTLSNNTGSAGCTAQIAIPLQTNQLDSHH